MTPAPTIIKPTAGFQRPRPLRFLTPGKYRRIEDAPGADFDHPAIYAICTIRDPIGGSASSSWSTPPASSRRSMASAMTGCDR
jgi:hypothetical protein